MATSVVDQQDINPTEAIAEAAHLVVAHAVDHLVREFFTADVADECLRLTPLHIVSDGVHEVGLAHADAAVEEERVIRLRGPLGDSLRGGHRELIAGADDEGVEVVARIELRGGVPVEARLLRGGSGGSRSRCAVVQESGCVGTVAGQRSKSAVLPHARRRGILRRCLEVDRVDVETKVIDRLLDEVTVAVADVGEVLRRDAHEHRPGNDARETRGLQPCLVGLPVDLLFKRTQNAKPVIQNCRWRWNERHSCFPCLNSCLAETGALENNVKADRNHAVSKYKDDSSPTGGG